MAADLGLDRDQDHIHGPDQVLVHGQALDQDHHPIMIMDFSAGYYTHCLNILHGNTG